MFASRKSRRGVARSRSRRAAADDTLDENAGTPEPKKRRVKNSSLSGLSFGEDEEDCGPTFKVSRSKARSALARQALEVTGPVAEGTSRHYTAEHLSELRETSFMLREGGVAADSINEHDVAAVVPPGAVLVHDIKKADVGSRDPPRTHSFGGETSEGTSRSSIEGTLERLAESPEDYIPFNATNAKASSRTQPHRPSVQRLYGSIGDDAEGDREWEAAQLQRAAASALTGHHGQVASSGSAHPKIMKPSEIVRSLRTELAEAQERLNIHRRELVKINADSSTAEELAKEQDRQLSLASARFDALQRLRDFVVDLCSCLRVKGAMIERVEDALHELRAEEHSARRERRLLSLGDELRDAEDAGLILSRGDCEHGLPAGFEIDETPATVVDEMGRDRAYSREQERSTRRLATLRRRAAAAERRRCHSVSEKTPAHPSPWCSGSWVLEGFAEEDDDEASECEAREIRESRIIEAAALIMEDVVDELRDPVEVKRRLDTFRSDQVTRDAFEQSYAALVLPDLLEPFARLELAQRAWDPRVDPIFDEKHLVWLSAVAVSGVEGMLETQSMLSALVERVVLAAIHDIVVDAWEPLSLVQTRSLVAAVRCALRFEKEPGSWKLREPLFEAIREKLVVAERELLVPIVRANDIAGEELACALRTDSVGTMKNSPEVMAAAMADRQLRHSVVLLRNATMWAALSFGAGGIRSVVASLLKKQAAAVVEIQASCSVLGLSDISYERRHCRLIDVVSAVAASVPATWLADEPWLRQATRPFFEALDERILRVNEQSSNKGWKAEFCSNAKELIAKFK